MQQTYRELLRQRGELEPNLSHLAQTVDTYLSPDTPLWIVQQQGPVGCLWLGRAVDQVYGLRTACIFLVYISPEHRHQGLATALLHTGEAWAMAHGYRQISLQVYTDNWNAQGLYQALGYQTQSLWMTKPLKR